MSDGTSTAVPSIECLSTERTSSAVFIRDSCDFDPVTVREAGAFAMLLEDQDFKFFMKLFHNIMPHVDLLYAKLQKKDIYSVHIRGESSSSSRKKIRYKDYRIPKTCHLYSFEWEKCNAQYGRSVFAIFCSRSPKRTDGPLLGNSTLRPGGHFGECCLRDRYLKHV